MLNVNPRNLFVLQAVSACALGVFVCVAWLPLSSLSSFLSGVVLVALLVNLVCCFLVYKAHKHASSKHTDYRFQSLLEHAPDAIVIINNLGEIVMVNQQTEQWFGYQRTELLGQALEILVPERFRAKHRIYRNHYIEQPTLRPMGVGVELFGLRKNNSEFPVEISLSPLSGENETLVSCFIRDITWRKQIEQARFDAQRQYQDLVDNVPVGVFLRTQGSSARLLEVNPAMVTMFEASQADELYAVNFFSLYSQDADVEKHDSMLLDKSVNHDEVLLRTLAGRNFYASIQTVVKQKSDGQLLLYGIIEDISERKHAEQVINELNETLMKRAQELESVNKELEAFSYSVSHDLRAPLRALDGFSRILLDEYQDRLDDKAKDRLSRIRKAAQTMSGLIDDLLQLSRITRVELTVKPVNLSQLATDIIVELQKEASEHQVSCIIQDNVTALGDAKLLRIVLVNLLGNAWKFTRNTDQAVIEFGVTSSETESSPIYFVRDNGAGFDMAYADKLFKAFQRLHSVNEFPGTGIGLATVYRIILKHSGRIWAQSEIGQGACFYFTLGK